MVIYEPNDEKNVAKACQNVIIYHRKSHLSHTDTQTYTHRHTHTHIYIFAE